MTRHFPHLVNTCDWLSRGGNLPQPIGSTTQIWVMTRHQCRISTFFPKTSFRGEIGGGGARIGSFTKCRLFSQATYLAPRFSHPIYLVEPLTRVMEGKTATNFLKGFTAFANLGLKAKITIHMHGTSSLSQKLLFTEEL